VEEQKILENFTLLVVKNQLPAQFVSCVAKTFNFAFVSSSLILFMKVFFT
jgi:hypothetical protein